MKNVLSAAAALLASATFSAVLVAQGTAVKPTPQTAKPASGSALPAGSATFVKSAAEGGQAEVQLATTAESKATNSEVKSLAETIHHDHEAANAELKTLAEKKNVTLPTAVSKTHQATANRLSKLSGAAFDKAYVDEMVKDHRADIATFQKHKTDADPDVAAFVTKTLPTLQNHLTMALNAQKAVGGRGGKH
jgi:putative membrane protein